jgi:hypothetical protein
MSALAEKIRRAREMRVEAGGFTFICRRPTDIEMLRITQAGDVAAFIPHVIGWEGVTENDICPGSSTEPLAFDAAACAEWLADRQDLLGRVMNKLRDAWADYKKQLEAAGKN